MFNKLSDLLTIKQKANQDVIDYLENDFWLWFDGAKHMTPLDVYLDSVNNFDAIVDILLPNQDSLEIWQSFNWPHFIECELSDGFSKECGKCLFLSFSLTKSALDYLQANQRNIYAELQKINPQLLARYQS